MRTLFNPDTEHSSCGVGFITRKSGDQTHEVLELAHQALCSVPHRGGMGADGVGDGAGVNIDISVDFFRAITGDNTLEKGNFAVANFFFPVNERQHENAYLIIESALDKTGLEKGFYRVVEVDHSCLNKAASNAQRDIHQFVIRRPKKASTQKEFETILGQALAAIEWPAFNHDELAGFYPLSMSSYTQVYKGRLNSGEVIPYFSDLSHPQHKISTLFFHTRFSTNTAPNPMFSQPFRRIAHNGELNTDRKNRLSEDAIAKSKGNRLIFPKGQSDSARLDQTLARRIEEDELDIVEAVLTMMPPAWEQDATLDQDVRDMLEYFSLSEEKNDGPAALIFSDGVKVGACLDRLGLRPLRSVETQDYLAVMSEAGQISFPANSVVERGRIEAGGMIVFDHASKKSYRTKDILKSLSQSKVYGSLLKDARVNLSDLESHDLASQVDRQTAQPGDLSVSAKHLAYSMNQESFKFMLDPMLLTGMEKVTAMGYGIAPNVLAEQEGGMSRYFSQRFAQVTNPPLDSLREADGMTLRVTLGGKAQFKSQTHTLKSSDLSSKQIVLESPILNQLQAHTLLQQSCLQTTEIEALFDFAEDSLQDNQTSLINAIGKCTKEAVQAVYNGSELIILDDSKVSQSRAAIPALLLISSVNQALIKYGLRFRCSVNYHTGQAASTHDIACLLGFGASAVYPVTVHNRAIELFPSEQEANKAVASFRKAADKALMKTMAKIGLCTVESYIGGEFLEANFIDTQDPLLAPIFPNINSPVGGAQFVDLVRSVVNWHTRATEFKTNDVVPFIGLFKERAEGAGHAFGQVAVREYIKMTEEPLQILQSREAEGLDEQSLDDPIIEAPKEIMHKALGYDERTPEQIDGASITPAYRQFCEQIYAERAERPATLRDVLALPLDFSLAETADEFANLLGRFNVEGNFNFSHRGLTAIRRRRCLWRVGLTNNGANKSASRLKELLEGIKQVFSGRGLIEYRIEKNEIIVKTLRGSAFSKFVSHLHAVREPISVDQVQRASTITRQLATGAMSHGALVAKAHEAVAHGANIAGVMSNSGEGGEHSSRFNSVKSSKIKQFASGRFGVWAGYLADPSLQEIEIKIAQGAKPGEGGQLPAAKVDVEIAAARNGTPGVELVSPPPHHDTYSIEDLGQLIHDAKASRKRVIVKLVSSEGIGTIAVGVAKAGADVINVAGNTGGTGAAQVTSLKNTGRVADIGIADVHQALSKNGLRDKVVLRCSNAHQTGLDVVKSAILGGDSFEFGTTALMMLKCVMAKNCNVKCPAGLTTNAEMYDGDPRALAQYFINLAHEVREILATLGYESLQEIRGQTQLLNLINHPLMLGQLDMSGMLKSCKAKRIKKAKYLRANFKKDDVYLREFKNQFLKLKKASITINGGSLSNTNKTVGGQLSVDIERLLNYELETEFTDQHPSIKKLANGRRILSDGSVVITTEDSAGQSFGAFNNSGVRLIHTGTCNDGVGKSLSGGQVIIRDPNLAQPIQENVLVGNFALFGASGGELYVQGQAGDRFAVRNSGAVAVVEGVGDFCCEYMTNGSVINIGSFGKGFANGMSGGVAYQYDRSGLIKDQCSLDSVRIYQLTDETELAQGQEQALLTHLEKHIEHTQSELAKSLLDDWQQAKRHFYFMLPRALFDYQDATAIAESMGKKLISDELAKTLSQRYLSELTTAYRDYGRTGDVLFSGRVPQAGSVDTPLIQNYLICSGILQRSLEVAKRISDNNHDFYARKMVASQDRRLVDVVVKDVRDALAEFSEEDLACLLAEKRLNDYKQSLKKREVCDSRALGTTAWILLRQKRNRNQLKETEFVDKHLASHYARVIAQSIEANAA